MRLRRRQKPCVRCGHFWEIHEMMIKDRAGEEIRVPCGYVELTPAFGGLFRYRACDCPGYVQPASRRLRWANRVLARRTPVLAFLYLIMAVYGVAALAFSLAQVVR